MNVGFSSGADKLFLGKFFNNTTKSKTIVIYHDSTVRNTLTLRRPKQHGPQVPDVPDLAQTVKSWSDLFSIFTNVFAGA